MGREELIGRFWYEMPMEWHEALDSCPAMEAMEAGRRIEVEKSTADGRTWLVQAAPLRDVNGGIVGGVEVSLDISKYKPAEEALEELPQEEREKTPADVDELPVDPDSAQS
jgi:PAS domain-containing protein